jgi:hypothetical protein
MAGPARAYLLRLLVHKVHIVSFPTERTTNDEAEEKKCLDLERYGSSRAYLVISTRRIYGILLGNSALELTIP